MCKAGAQTCLVMYHCGGLAPFIFSGAVNSEFDAYHRFACTTTTCILNTFSIFSVSRGMQKLHLLSIKSCQSHRFHFPSFKSSRLVQSRQNARDSWTPGWRDRLWDARWDHLTFSSSIRLLNFVTGLTTRSVVPPEEQAFATMRATLNKGCNFWNGGEFYGPPDRNSLTLLRKYYEKYPEDADNIVLNIKGATRILPTLRPDGSPEFVKESVYKCLEMLGPRGRIDMFECARRDPNVPLEKTLGALAELVQAGKIGGIALSEVNAGTIREAAKITKIVAVEIELSLWRTEPLTNGIATACAELDIPIIA